MLPFPTQIAVRGAGWRRHSARTCTGRCYTSSVAGQQGGRGGWGELAPIVRSQPASSYNTRPSIHPCTALRGSPFSFSFPTVVSAHPATPAAPLSCLSLCPPAGHRSCCSGLGGCPRQRRRRRCCLVLSCMVLPCMVSSCRRVVARVVCLSLGFFSSSSSSPAIHTRYGLLLQSPQPFWTSHTTTHTLRPAPSATSTPATSPPLESCMFVLYVL